MNFRSNLIIYISLMSVLKAQVGINILTPHPSAAMQVESPAGTQRGLLTPSMTSINRISISSGTAAPADGLVVYDITHKMHYYYQANPGKWISLSPLVLSTPSNTSSVNPSGAITTPSPGGPYAFGINTQNPTQALHVVGNATVSNNASIGGNFIVNGNSNLSGTVNVTNALNVNGFPVNALVPAGAIVMYSGTLIPMGWGLCDGTVYGTLVSPDLRGRFIVGVNNYSNTQSMYTGQYLMYGQSGVTPAVAPNDGTTLNYGTIGNKGGENGHVITLPESASHTHSVAATISNGNFYGPNTTAATLHSGLVPMAKAIQPTISVSETIQGGNQPHENRPPYYVLAFIIKLP